MFSFRCTQKLIKKLGLSPISDPPVPTTQLGDWYGNVFYIKHQQLMMFVSDRSLLPVIMPLRERRDLLINFKERLFMLLFQLGVEERLVSDEFRKMDDVLIAKTASRSVLGSMNDFIQLAKDYFQMQENVSLLELELWLSEVPCGAMDYLSPKRVAPELLAKAGGR